MMLVAMSCQPQPTEWIGDLFVVSRWREILPNDVGPNHDTLGFLQQQRGGSTQISTTNKQQANNLMVFLRTIKLCFYKKMKKKRSKDLKCCRKNLRAI